MRVRNLLAVFLSFSCLTGVVNAEVKIGVIYSATGPGASVGTPQQRLLPVLPKTLGGEKVNDEHIVGGPAVQCRYRAERLAVHGHRLATNFLG